MRDHITPPPPGRAASDTVPFISDWRDTRSFSDVSANAGVTDTRKMLEGWTATREKALRGVQLEAQVGDWNTVPASLLELLARYRRSVARIVVPPGQTNFRQVRADSGWTGTGFLVAPNLLLTNHHVLNSAEVAGVATAEFDYEWPSDKLFANVGTPEPPTVRFDLAPTRLFVTSPVGGGGLDYSFVWISDKASEQFGKIRMERGSFMINQYEPTFVIHHPKGRLKEVSLDDTELLAVNALNILYAADTDFGSSGACVFNRNGRLVALHHARQEGEALRRNYPEAAQRLSDGRAVEVGNEGIKISAIALDLEARTRRGDTDSESAAEVLAQIEGSDTLTGVFGALGRTSSAEGDAARVRDLYQGTDQDIDIGFWNMHWLTDSGAGPVRVEDAVTAMADLNQDIWCLTDVSPLMVGDIVAGLSDRFGEEFAILFSEDGASQLRLATAVIWRPGTASCTKEDWPAAVAGAWTRPVPDIEGGGGIFQSPPARYRIGSPSRPDVGINLVPVSIRPLRSDELRRRLASKLLARAVDLTITATSGTSDWIIGGTFEPPLADEESAALQARDYEVMSAADKRRGGAVNFLRARTSGIGNIFVTADLDLIGDKHNFFDVVTDRTVDKYINKLADNRPAVLRLSLDKPGATLSEQTLDATINSLMSGAPARAAVHSLAPWHDGLDWRGRDKVGFLLANRDRFHALLAQTAANQRQIYPDLSPLTLRDLWVIIFAEAGLGPGSVDPQFRHSNGEIGLFPLPSNIAFWIGADAPAWNQPMPLATNIESYARYLGQIRNKTVATSAGRALYRDLFREPGIAREEARQAKLLAAIVHGYFVRANYREGAVPFQHLLSGLAQDVPVDRLLSGTSYVHAGSSILTNRQRNIDAALDAYTAAMV
ncbi:trypsin-like serine peptidase [Arenibacterium halophilum]|nr:serine protease [Arenibacterium halophilum]